MLHDRDTFEPSTALVRIGQGDSATEYTPIIEPRPTFADVAVWLGLIVGVGFGLFSLAFVLARN